MADLTAREQLMLELINRARMDPRGEAARLGVTLAPGESKPVPVLAGNDALKAAAYNHSGWMLLNDSFTRDQHEDSQSYIAETPLDRMKAYGYPVGTTYSYAENISWNGSVTVPDFTLTIVDQHESLFASAGARARMLKAVYQEVGIGQQAGDFEHAGETFVTSMVTQDFIASGAKAFITGVLYDDGAAANDVYDAGEGTAGRKVSAAGAKTDKAGAGGGYELEFTSTGIKNVTFDLKGGDLKLDVALGPTNVKIDAVNGHEIWTNASVQSQSAAITELHALGVSPLVLIGSRGAQTIEGNRAANQLLGLRGADTISGHAGKDTIAGGRGSDALTGGAGADIFVYAARKDSKPGAPDTITDFHGHDRIDLDGLYSGRLRYRDETPITGAHEVNVTASGGDVIVHVNLDADSADELTIVLAGTDLGAMTRGDFIL